MKQPCPEVVDQLGRLAYIAACELDSPNSPEFDRIYEQQFQKLLVQHGYAEKD